MWIKAKLSACGSRIDSMFDASNAAAAALRSAVDGLLELDLTGVAGPDLIDHLREVEVQRRRLAAADQALLAEIDARCLAADAKCRDTAALMVDVLHVDPSEARRRVDDAIDFRPKVTHTGEMLEPTFPQTGTAIEAGAISVGHARAVARFLDQLPRGLEPAVLDTLEADLLETATHTHPAQLGKITQQWLARIDQDGAEPRDDVRARRRGFTVSTAPDGWSRVTGDLSPLLTATLNVIFDSLAAPVPAENGGTPGSEGVAAGGGQQDDRTPAARRHDALLDACQRVLRSGTLPTCAGTPATVLVTISESSLRDRVGYATTAHADLLPIADVLRIAAEAQIIPVVLADSGGVASFGQGQRLASPGQRRALAARDSCCSFPGCTAPPGWVQVHHIEPWQTGGPTDLTNMTLVCGHHHRQFERQGWDCVMIDSVPHWRPPAWIDPDRIPRRNTAHHVEPSFRLPQSCVGNLGGEWTDHCVPSRGEL